MVLPEWHRKSAITADGSFSHGYHHWCWTSTRPFRWQVLGHNTFLFGLSRLRLISVFFLMVWKHNVSFQCSSCSLPGHSTWMKQTLWPPGYNWPLDSRPIQIYIYIYFPFSWSKIAIFLAGRLLLSCIAQVFSSAGYGVRVHPCKLNTVSEFIFRHNRLINILTLWAWIDLWSTTSKEVVLDTLTWPLQFTPFARARLFQTHF